MLVTTPANEDEENILWNKYAESFDLVDRLEILLGTSN